MLPICEPMRIFLISVVQNKTQICSLSLLGFFLAARSGTSGMWSTSHEANPPQGSSHRVF